MMQAYDYSPFGALLPDRMYSLTTRSVSKPGLLFKYNFDFNDGTTQGYTANGGYIKNLGNRLYAYTLGSGVSPGVRRNYTGLTAGIAYTITFTVDDSIGTNTYSIYVRDQTGTIILVQNIVSRGTYSYNFTLPGSTTAIQFFINSGNSAILPLPAHNFYVDNVTIAYPGMTTVQEAVDTYKFGFNGKEKDNDFKGIGNSYDFGSRIYDSRLGRWLSTDPLQAKYPGLSPYVFCANNPIIFDDVDGKDFRYKVRDVGRTLKEVTVQTTVHLYGADADLVDTRTYEQNRMYEMPLLDRNGLPMRDQNGKEIMQRVIVKVEAKFVVHASREEAEAAMKANPGDNMMQVDVTLTNEQMVDFGNGPEKAPVPNKVAGTAQRGGNKANARDVGRKTLIHEIMHNIGLGERYDGDSGAPDPGFQGTVMTADPGVTDINFHPFNVKDLGNYVLKLAKNRATQGFETKTVDDMKPAIVETPSPTN